MEISRPGARPPTPEEIKELDRLKTLIEQAVADGIVTQAEMDNIKAAILSHRKPEPEQLWREITLYRSLVTQKIKSGELECESLGNLNFPI